MAKAPLGVWLHGRHVAQLTSKRPGQVVCQYTNDALDTWPGGTPLLSCSLPLGPRPLKDAGLYFRGLLPEGQHREAMAAAANVAIYDTFGMLARFGRDVAGAAVIGFEPLEDRPGSAVPYSPEELGDEVAGLEERPLALYDDSELSLAGLQNKLLLVATDGGWARPVGGFPSTHILKVEDRRYPRMVTMEAVCLNLARALDLTTVVAHVEQFSGLDCLIVSRFDRQGEGANVQRVHQEDACQALGRNPDDAQRRGKYEQAGGPALREVAELLDRHGLDPLSQLRQLVRIATYTVAIGNADAHGKNLSVLHPVPGHIVLAPLYDTVPTALWPKLTGRAAMSINKRPTLAEVGLADIAEEARSWAFDPSVARDAAIEVGETILEVLPDLDAPPELKEYVHRRTSTLLHS